MSLFKRKKTSGATVPPILTSSVRSMYAKLLASSTGGGPTRRLEDAQDWITDHERNVITGEVWDPAFAGAFWSGAMARSVQWSNLFEYYKLSKIVSTDPALAGAGAFHWFSGDNFRYGGAGLLAFQPSDSQSRVWSIVPGAETLYFMVPGLRESSLEHISTIAQGEYAGWSYDYAGIEMVGMQPYGDAFASRETQRWVK